jgi:hypothetical protein
MTSLALLSWFQVASFLQAQEPGTHVFVRASQVEHPRDAGMMPSLSMPLGQRASYQLDMTASQRLTVLDFAKHYLARLDPVESGTGLEAALRKAPGSTVMGTAALGALIGLACGRSQGAAFAGAALGGLVALAGLALASAESAPKATDVATAIIESWPSSAGKATKEKSSPARHVRILRKQAVSSPPAPSARSRGRQPSKAGTKKSHTPPGQKT